MIGMIDMRWDETWYGYILKGGIQSPLWMNGWNKGKENQLKKTLCESRYRYCQGGCFDYLEG